MILMIGKGTCAWDSGSENRDPGSEEDTLGLWE